MSDDDRAHLDPLTGRMTTCHCREGLVKYLLRRWSRMWAAIDDNLWGE